VQWRKKKRQPKERRGEKLAAAEQRCGGVTDDRMRPTEARPAQTAW
jgi:hypothetical protein